MGLLRKVTGKKERRQKYSSWRKEALVRMLQGAGIQPLHTYIDRR